MTKNLAKYMVEVAIGGINRDIDSDAKQEFYLELDMRPHILSKKLFWDKGGETLIVRTEIESITEDLAAKQMAEELFEVANAVLYSVEGLSVKVIAVKQLGQ